MWRRIPVLVSALLFALAAPNAVAQELKVQSLHLRNGLTVLAMEDHTVPSVALQIVFKVGSRNERPGITGLSHLFEHMMFNGSAHYKPKVFDQLIEAGGGYSNAFTTSDTTEYYEEFSSPTLDTVLRLEADRMRALRLDKGNIEQERSIVKEERRENYDNSVTGAMAEALWNTAFVAHPYRWLTIGFMRDIDAITLQDARDYFRIHYAPNNAVMAVVGDFQTATLFAKVQAYFGDVSREPPPRPVVLDEPTQLGERRVSLHRPAELPAVMIGYHIGSMFDPDDPALDVLSAVLSSGESSRLYRSLVYEKQVATEVDASNESRHDPGLFTFYAQAQQGHTAMECEQGIYATLTDIEKSGITDRELQKAKNILRAGYLGGFKTNSGRAGLLAEYQANYGDWHRLLDYLPRHDRVTATDIQRVTARYFSDRNRTVVTLIPEPLAAGAADQGQGGPPAGPLR